MPVASFMRLVHASDQSTLSSAEHRRKGRDMPVASPMPRFAGGAVAAPLPAAAAFPVVPFCPVIVAARLSICPMATRPLVFVPVHCNLAFS